ncbi:MAG: DDE-type integrase/transposase/recombinase, partial [Candidatus Thiodiazotropha taylori]|nr:DDE-type integrase/transposase/recombinase [Candidatus Thiodiazotropha taylori]
FNALKTSITSTDVMAYYNENAETNLLVDGSPFGLGAILTQKQPDGNFRPVAYASRTLNAVERRYSQIEREALAILWGISRFEVYLYGLNFTVYTDNRPLERVFSSSHDTLSPRIQKWVLKLQSYTFTVKYRPGSSNPADILSRPQARELNDMARDEMTNETEQFISILTDSSLPIALTKQELQLAAQQDEIFQQVRHALQTDRWKRKGNLKPYFQVRHELSVKDDLILKGSKLVIPTRLQTRVLELAHESHRGLKKTKQLLRSKVWFPNIDQKVDKLIQSCHTCQMTSIPPRAPPVIMSKLPDGPWKKVGLDLSGPYGSNNEHVLAIIDYYSRFPIAEIIQSTTSATIINKLRQVFAMHGLVEEIVTDNASNLTSVEFENFLREHGIKHSRISPYWSRNNGLVENFNRSVRKAVRVAQVQNKNWRTELYTFLLHYRATEHSTTGFAPAQLLYNREIRTKLPQVDKTKAPKGLRSRDTLQKQRIKQHADKSKAKSYRKYKVGQKVLILKTGKGKMSPLWDSRIFEVINQKGAALKLKSNSGVLVYRNATHVRPYFQRNNFQKPSTLVADQGLRMERQKRITRLPKKFMDYHM